MTDTVYCLGCGQAFSTGLSSDEYCYPLSSGMCKPCVQEGRRRPWQIIAENGRLREENERLRERIAYLETEHGENAKRAIQ